MSSPADPSTTSAETSTNASQPLHEPRPRGGWLRRQFSDILHVARRDKKWWLLPLVFLLLMLAALMIFASAIGPLAPFVYPFL